MHTCRHTRTQGAAEKSGVHSDDASSDNHGHHLHTTHRVQFGQGSGGAFLLILPYPGMDVSHNLLDCQGNVSQTLFPGISYCVFDKFYSLKLTEL